MSLNKKVQQQINLSIHNEINFILYIKNMKILKLNYVLILKCYYTFISFLWLSFSMKLKHHSIPTLRIKMQDQKILMEPQLKYQTIKVWLAQDFLMAHSKSLTFKSINYVLIYQQQMNPSQVVCGCLTLVLLL